MNHDLLFHIVEKKAWKRLENAGQYEPASIEEEGFIHCSTGFQINDTANRVFENQRHLLLLIIDVKRVEAPIKYEKDADLREEFPHICGPLNTNAVLDKISLNPDKKGKFSLDFSSD
jgi:uncharacterized protein (DUF952 family)